MSAVFKFDRYEEQSTRPSPTGRNLFKAEFIDLDGNVERTLLSADNVTHAVQILLDVGDIKHVDQVTMLRRIGAPSFAGSTVRPKPRHWYGNAETAPPAAETPIVDRPEPEQKPLFTDDMLADVHAYLNRCTDVFRIGDRRGDSIEEIAKQIEAVPVPDGVSAYVALVDKALLDR